MSTNVTKIPDLERNRIVNHDKEYDYLILVCENSKRKVLYLPRAQYSIGHGTLQYNM